MPERLIGYSWTLAQTGPNRSFHQLPKMEQMGQEQLGAP